MKIEAIIRIGSTSRMKRKLGPYWWKSGGKAALPNLSLWPAWRALALTARDKSRIYYIRRLGRAALPPLFYL